MTLIDTVPAGGRDKFPGFHRRSAKARVINEAAVIHEPATRRPFAATAVW